MDSNQAHQLSLDFGRQISVHAAQKKRGGHQSNIWIFDSPKNEKRFRILGDVAYMHVVLLEGDPNVSRYEIESPTVYGTIDGEWHRTELDAIVYFAEGRSEWWEFKRSVDAGAKRAGRARTQLLVQAQAAQEAGIKHVVRTELDLRGREILFDNWALLCAAITRARGQSRYIETRVFTERLDTHGTLTVGSMLNDPDCDPAVMLAVIAQSLQTGTAVANLEHQLFSPLTTLQRRAS